MGTAAPTAAPTADSTPKPADGQMQIGHLRKVAPLGQNSKSPCFSTATLVAAVVGAFLGGGLLAIVVFSTSKGAVTQPVSHPKVEMELRKPLATPSRSERTI